MHLKYINTRTKSVAEGEGIEIVSDLNDEGKVLIGFIEVEEDQSIDELPDRDNVKCEMMISGKATEGATLDSGEYDLIVTVQGKATGNVTLSVKPVSSITGMDVAENSENADTAAPEESALGGHTNWTQAVTAEEACEGAGLDSLADLNGRRLQLCSPCLRSRRR